MMLSDSSSSDVAVLLFKVRVIGGVEASGGSGDGPPCRFTLGPFLRSSTPAGFQHSNNVDRTAEKGRYVLLNIA